LRDRLLLLGVAMKRYALHHPRTQEIEYILRDVPTGSL